MSNEKQISTQYTVFHKHTLLEVYINLPIELGPQIENTCKEARPAHKVLIATASQEVDRYQSGSHFNELVQIHFALLHVTCI